MFEFFSVGIKPTTTPSPHQTSATSSFQPAQKALPASTQYGGEAPSPKNCKVCGSTGLTPPAGRSLRQNNQLRAVTTVGVAHGSAAASPFQPGYPRSVGDGQRRRCPPGAGGGEPGPQPPLRRRGLPPAGTAPRGDGEGLLLPVRRGRGPAEPPDRAGGPAAGRLPPPRT